MHKFDSQPTSLTLPPASHSDLASSLAKHLVEAKGEPARWLIVLVPGLEADLIPATRRIWELANTAGRRVRFIGFYSNAAQELSLRRQLIIMSAMVNDDRMFAEIEVAFGNDWVELLRSRWQAGDVVVCFAEHRVGPLNRPLSQILQSDLDVPLFILSGLYPQNDSRSNWPVQVAAWMGSIAIICGFFMLQIRIDHLAKDWTHLTLLMLSIPVEVCMLWFWNNLFR